MSGDLGRDETSLIARPEALNAFHKMRTEANRVRKDNRLSLPEVENNSPNRGSNEDDVTIPGCFPCLGIATRRPVFEPLQLAQARPRREYHPENVSVQPQRQPWTEKTEWLVIACIDFLEHNALEEPRLFAVSAVEDML
eukprot:IDg19292t1